MTTINQISKGQRRIGMAMSALVVLFMLFDGIFKFIQPEEVITGTLELGFARHHIAVLGMLGLVSTICYIIPRTAVVGAILLTAYFGGAVATHLRLDNPLFSHILFSVYLAVLAWGGIWLRYAHVRGLFGWKESNTESRT